MSGLGQMVATSYCYQELCVYCHEHVCLYTCLSVSLPVIISLELHVRSSPSVRRMSPTAAARSCFGRIAICYVAYL